MIRRRMMNLDYRNKLMMNQTNFKSYGWKKYCAGKNIALLKERCLKWFLSKRWPFCRFFDKNSPNSASFYPICTGFSRSISTERGLSFQLRGWGAQINTLGAISIWKLCENEGFSFSAFSQKIFLLVKVKGTLQTGHFLDIDHFKNVSFSSARFFPAQYFFHP